MSGNRREFGGGAAQRDRRIVTPTPHVLLRELVRGLGPSIKALSQKPPFATFDGRSKRTPRTLDYIFVRARQGCSEYHQKPEIIQSATIVGFINAHVGRKQADHKRGPCHSPTQKPAARGPET
jgi:hypothetical protein